MSGDMLTIAMTDRPPVRLKKADWPKIAGGFYSEHDGQIPSQANRTTEAYINVRRNADGRAVVYGSYEYDTSFQGERNVSAKAGALLAKSDGEQLVHRIHAVADALFDATGADDALVVSIIRECARKCVADLPPEDI